MNRENIPLPKSAVKKGEEFAILPNQYKSVKNSIIDGKGDYVVAPPVFSATSAVWGKVGCVYKVCEKEDSDGKSVKVFIFINNHCVF